MADGKIWILDAIRWRASWPETRERIKQYALGWRPDSILLEEVSFEELSVRELVDAGLPVAPTHPSKDKVARFLPVHSRFAHGQVFCSELLSKEYIDEMVGFPDAPHDDWPDATALAVTAVDRELNEAWRSSAGDTGYHWNVWRWHHPTQAKRVAVSDPQPAAHSSNGAEETPSRWRFAG